MRTQLSSIGSAKLLRLLLAVLLSGGLTVGGGWISPELAGMKPAFADDDDDDDDDGYDDDDDDVFRAIRRHIVPRLQRRSAPRRTQAPAPPPPIRDPDEIVGSGFSAAELDQLVASGFEIIERQPLAAFDTEVIKLQIPPGTTLEAAREQAGTFAPQAVIDFNHYYRPEQEAGVPCVSTDCLARTVVGWPADLPESDTCRTDLQIGLVDTAINADHSTFAGSGIEVIRIGDAELPESGKQHGTAVAALLVGSPASRTPGLVPDARLIAVDAFYRAKFQDERSEVYSLVRALELLAERDVDVVNLSLAGPANLLLEQAVQKLAEQGAIMVAAAGNEGPNSDPVYPAAYEQVVAVTAIDRRKRPYRRAGRGEHIDFAAPGVEVWTAASISGRRPKTGTSFAAPFVTAAAALMKASDPTLTPESIRQALTQNVEDLGDPGKDPVFGWGLLDARSICQAAP